MYFIESHPLTIINAPSDITCITDPNDQGILLAARVSGDWSSALNAYATNAASNLQDSADAEPKDPETGPSRVSPTLPQVRALVTLSGPYSPTSIDLGEYENVLLFAGGSGLTFTLSLLDDIVGRCARLNRRGGEVTRRIEFDWCIRSFGAIQWFAGYMQQIAEAAASRPDLDLHISIYVTCLCDPEAIPPIPNCDVTIERPDVYSVLTDLLTPPSPNSEAGTESESESSTRPLHEKLPWVPLGGGVAVCASGPETMTREASNAVARLRMSSRGRGLGNVGLSTELFAI